MRHSKIGQLSITLACLLTLQACSNQPETSEVPPLNLESQVAATTNTNDHFQAEYQKMRLRYSQVELNKPEVKPSPIIIAQKIEVEAEPVQPIPVLEIEDRISPQFLFKPGQYLIPDNASRFELENWIKDNLSELKHLIEKHQQQYGAEYEISALIIGSSNGVSTRPGGVPYQGELGDIVIDQTALIDKPESINITQNTALTNEELSAVRAYSVTQKFSNHFEGIALSFDIRTVDKSGSQYRYSQIILKVQPKV